MDTAPTVTTRPLRIAYVGNFQPEHSTENHVRQAAERVGHTVIELQENTAGTWDLLRTEPEQLGADLLLWTRTGWDWPAMTGWSWEQATQYQADALDALRAAGVPSVGFHLDRWWGLDREAQVYDEPFFGCDLVCTADGGHQAEWEAADVNHHWLPPGVLLAECERQPSANAHAEPIVWVGSWQRYHAEWLPYRRELVQGLRRRYRRQFGIYPRRGQGLRGEKLTDLYAATKVVVGDSCLAGGATHYWSDRIPETLGRGGLLLHPEVEGLDEHYTPGEHLLTYELGDWDGLHRLIDWVLANPEQADVIRREGRHHVMAHHTYEVRVQQLVQLATDQGLLPA
jgi:hypothetical protein